MGVGEQHYLDGQSHGEPGPGVGRHILLRRRGADQVPAGEAVDDRPALLQAREDLGPGAAEDGGPRALRRDHRGHGPHAGQDRRRRHYRHGRLCLARRRHRD